MNQAQNKQVNKVQVWWLVPLFFCFVAPQITKQRILQGSGKIYSGMLCALLVWAFVTAVLGSRLRLGLRQVKVGSGPFLARFEIVDSSIEVRVVPLSASIQTDVSEKSSYLEQFKSGIASLSGHLATGVLAVLILGIEVAGRMIGQIPASVHGLLTGPWSFYRVMGDSVVGSGQLETLGCCLLVSSVFNLLPVPTLGGGQFLLGLLALAKRQNFNQILGRRLETLNILTLLALMVFFLWILGRVAFYLVFI